MFYLTFTGNVQLTLYKIYIPFDEKKKSQATIKHSGYVKSVKVVKRPNIHNKRLHMKTKQQFLVFAYQKILLHIKQTVCFDTCMQQIPYCNLMVAQLIKKFTSFIKPQAFFTKISMTHYLTLS
jgi:hypothetical protein